MKTQTPLTCTTTSYRLHQNGDRSNKWKSQLNMKVVAEILTGTLFYVEVGEDANIRDLKEQIANQENLPRDKLILMLDSDERILLDKDDVQLKDYGVQDSSHIYIFFLSHNDVSPSTPKESASSEPSSSMNEPPKEDNDNETQNDAKEDEPSNYEPSNEADEPSPSVDPSSAQSEQRM